MLRFAAWLSLAFSCAAAVYSATPVDANRLAYLDEPCDPYYPSRTFPKLITPQWVGEEGVDAVVVLAIDDMRGHEKWETYLRPILDRLKKIDGRAPVSIMTCDIKPDDPHLQTWLKEGVSLEVHTVDHPCPVLKDGDFAKAKSTFDRCVDLMASIPNNKPVAFRTPCCDSLNTPSPRLWAEIFGKTTPKGNYLQIDSSVFNIFTPNDPDLPREVVLENGKERFRKYVPFKSFVNTIEDYPYPYVIGRTCWQFPCVVPSDWQAQNIQRPNNPQTVEDMKFALDATVIKQGVFNLVFHPHGWIRNDQIVELIDYAQKKYGKRVKFLNFREALERLNKNLCSRTPIRAADGRDAGVRIIDLNGDGYLDVIVSNAVAKLSKSRLWAPREKTWKVSEFPTALVDFQRNGKTVPAGASFGIVGPQKHVVAMHTVAEGTDWEFDGSSWRERRLFGYSYEVDLVDDTQPAMRLRDIDGDGQCELIISNTGNNSVWQLNEKERKWDELPFTLPDNAMFVDDQPLADDTREKGRICRDAGLRLVDLDEDGDLDIIFSNEKEFGVYLFTDMKQGWSQKVRAGKRGDKDAIPAITRGGTNNGAWFHSRYLWVQNEDTARMPDLVDRVSFNDLLGDTPPAGKSPAAALKSIRVRPGFVVEQVAAEPLVMDPVALDWGPDGKLWVCEMADYPLGIDGHGKRGGRVRFLEDTNGDGKYDKSTVFLDGLGYPNGVMAWKKGVLVTCAPDLIYAEDTDGDGRADKREDLFTGFTPGNPQHCINGPTWGLDNWVYLANGDSGGEVSSRQTPVPVSISGRDVRVKIDERSPDNGRIDPQAGQTQFGRARNDWGDWFGSNNPNPIWQYVLEDHYLRRNEHVIAPDPRRPLGRDLTIARVFPMSRTFARFNDLHTANRFTSCCGITIYRDELFGPEFASDTLNTWFTCEPVHNLVHRGQMTADGCGFEGRRADDEQEREFLSSTDNWFRPTMARTGPDGALWITDMYRAVIEHPEWIPDDWEAKLDLRAGSTMGRIYRVYPVGVKPRPIPRLDRLDTPGLVAALDSPNGWQRDMAHRMLVARGDAAAVPLLERMSREAKRPEARLQAICALDGLAALRPEVVAERLADPHAGVRRHAVRLTEGHVAKSAPLADALVKLVESSASALPKGSAAPLAAATEPIANDARVRLQLGYNLGEWRDARAGRLLGILLARNVEDDYITAAAMSSVNRDNVDMVLATVLGGVDGRPPTNRLVGRLLVLSAALGDRESLIRVLDLVGKPDASGRFAAWQLGALAGVLDEIDRRKTPLAGLGEEVSPATRKAIAAVVSQARRTSDDAKADEAELLAAVRLLGRDAGERAGDLARLAKLLAPQASQPLQEAAIHSLSRIDDPRVADALLAGWSAHTPALRRAVLDALLARDAWTSHLLDQLEQRKVAAAELDATRRSALLAYRNAEIRARATKLLATSLDADRARVVADHRDVLRLAGDANRGGAVFAKRCAACHRLQGVGHDVGADLTALVNRSPEALLLAILDPNRAVEEKFISYLIRTNDGRQLTGILASESGASVTLVGQDGKREALLRGDIDEMKSTGKSFMPEGLEKDLSKQDLADVMVYLARLGPVAKTFDGNRPATIAAADDGSLVLSASTASIFGPTLVFEQHYGNLGYWSSAADHASWRLTVPKAGVYRVLLDYACENAMAGGPLVIEFGGVRLATKVEGTGTWDDYRQTELGTVELVAGEQIVVARSGGEVARPLLDLRQIKLAPAR